MNFLKAGSLIYIFQGPLGAWMSGTKTNTRLTNKTHELFKNNYGIKVIFKRK